MSEALNPAATVARRTEAPAGLAALLRVFVVPVLGFLGFFVALVIGVHWDRIPVLGLAIATGTLILTVVAVDRTRPRERRNLLLSILSFAYFVFMVLPAFVFYLGDSGYQTTLVSPIPPTPPVIVRGLLAAFVAYAILLATFALPFGAMAADFLPRMKREWSAGATLGVALVTIPLGWAVLLGSQVGLIPERAGSGVLGTIAQGSMFGIALAALCYQRYRSRAAFSLLAVIVPMTMFFNFFTSSKGAFLRPIVMIAIVHVIVTRRLRMWWIAGFIAFASLIYPVSMAYRDFMNEHALQTLDVIKSPQAALRMMGGVLSTAEPGEYLRQGLESTAHRLDGLSQLSVIMRDTPGRVPFQGGWSIAYIPLSYIPRILWPGKPKFQSGQWVTENYGAGPGILSATGPSWMGELYYNFGWAGILVGMALLGVWFRFLQDSFLRMDSTIPAMMAGVVTILVLAPALGGDLLSPTNGVVFNVAPIVLTHLLISRFTPPPARLPPPL